MLAMLSKNNSANQTDSSLRSTDIPETSSIRGIRYLTCQGGGMKGIGDVGAVEELEKCGVLAQLEEVAGSSAGGLLATLLAIGCTAKEIRQEMLAIDFRAFQDKREPGWIESIRLKDVASSNVGGKQSVADRVSLIRQTSAINEATEDSRRHSASRGRGQGFFSKVKKIFSIPEQIEDIAGLALGSDLGLWEGEALSQWLSDIVARKTGKPNITFRELAELAKANGSQIKRLTLTGSNISDGVLEYYNATNTPDMPIVQAARISASFPGAYKPVIMVDETGQRKVKVDGGLLENLPDVFNKEPYVSAEELTKEGGNPRAFALVFRDPRKQGPKKVENGLDLAKALYSTKMSESPLHKKYGSNIAFIDTVGMDTLEFDAPMEKREALARSGGVAVNKALRKVLKEEENRKHVNYHEMSVEELVRREVALKSMSGEGDDESELAKELLKIQKALEEHEVSEIELQELRKIEENRLMRRKKRENPEALEDEELAQVCADKIRELSVIEKQLKEKVKNLEIAKNAIQFNCEEILTRFKSDNFNNDFYQELHELKRMESNINANRLQKSEFRDNHRKNKLLDAEYATLKAERAQYLKGIIKKYQSHNDSLLSNFFKDVEEDCDNLDFSVPVRGNDLVEYCLRDVDACVGFIEKAKIEVKDSKKELELFRQYQRNFSERTDKSRKYSELLNFKKELDRTIYRKTSFLAKLDNFILKKSPRFEKVIAPFLQVVSFLSFVCWLPIAIPAIGITKAIGHFSKDPEVQTTASRVVDFFHWTDLSANKRLQGLRDATATCIRKISDDYTEPDSDMTYLRRMHSHYLKESGVAVEDIFSRNPNESLSQYRRRLDREKDKFEVESSHTRSTLKPHQKERGKSPSSDEYVSKNLEVFRSTVLDGVSRITEREKAHLEEAGSSYKPKVREKFMRQQQARSMHLQCLRANSASYTVGDHYTDVVQELHRAHSSNHSKRNLHHTAGEKVGDPLKLFLEERNRTQHKKRGKLVPQPHHHVHRKKTKPDADK